MKNIKPNVSINESPIISNREARKLLGKKVSTKLNNKDLMGTILAMTNLANCLLHHDSSSKNQKGMVE